MNDKPEQKKMHRLLSRQIKKHLPESLLANEEIKRFIESINNSYEGFDRDRELNEHAHRVSDEQYARINKKLSDEIELKQLGIKNIQEAINSLLDEESNTSLSLESNFLDTLNILKTHIERRKLAEQELNATAKRLSQLIENLHEGVLVEDESGTIVLINQSFCELFECRLDPQSIIGKPYTILSDSLLDVFSLSESFLARKKQIVQRRVAVIGEILETKDGRSIKRDYLPIYSASGEYRGHLWKYLDITSEQRFQREIERLSLVASKNNNGVLFTSPDGIVNWTNEGFINLTGYSREEILSKNPIDLCKGPETNRDVLQEMIVAFTNGEPFDCELLHYKKDGSSFWGRARGQSTKDEEGNVTGYFAMIEDVTKEREHEDKLRLSEQRWQFALEGAGDGVWEYDFESGNWFFSQKAQKLLNISNASVSSAFIPIHKEDISEYQKVISNYEAGDQTAHRIEYRIVDRKGNRKWILDRGKVMTYDEQGLPKKIIGILTDISEQKKLEAELVKAREAAEISSKAKEVFLANMSHEIRTPINGIMGMTRQLYRSTIDEDQKFYIDTISNATENLLVILNDILDISKIEAGQLTIEQIDFSLSETIKKSLMVLKSKSEEKGLELSWKLDPNIPDMLVGDPYRINQLLLNLVGNAIKFTDKGFVRLECMLISGSEKAQSIEFTISDSGIGMSEEFIKRIFNQFTQEEYSTTRKYGGSGLGMAICKQLVELMNGSIEVKSRKGEGTVVRFILPLEVSSAPEVSESMQTNKDQSENHVFDGKKILVVEDNELNQLVLKATLKFHGIDFEIANNGLEAFEMMKSRSFNLILMDIQMPVMNGLEATQKIRNELKNTVPILGLSADPQKTTIENCIKAGMNAFLAKPFSEDKLIASIAQWLNEPEYQMNGKDQSIPTKSDHTEKLYRLDDLLGLARDDKAFLIDVIKTFQELCNQTTVKLKSALNSKDVAGMKSLVHSLKSGAGNFQMTAALQLIQQLEEVDETNFDLSQLKMLIDQLENILKTVVSNLDEEVVRL